MQYSTMQRAFEIAKRLYSGASISAMNIKKEFGVSKSTAQRDMDQIECALPVIARKIDSRTVFSLR